MLKAYHESVVCFFDGKILCLKNKYAIMNATKLNSAKFANAS